jgi:hypothetical protein
LGLNRRNSGEHDEPKSERYCLASFHRRFLLEGRTMKLSALELGPVDPGSCSLPCLTLMESDLRVILTP